MKRILTIAFLLIAAISFGQGKITLKLPQATGGGLSGGNLGGGYRFYYVPSQGIRTLYNGYGFIIDSTSNANGITLTLDTTYATGIKTNLRATNDSAVLAAAINLKSNIASPSFTGKMSIVGSSLQDALVTMNNGTLPSVIEFSKNGHTVKGSVGAMGGFETNLGYNLQYYDGSTHEYYNSAKGAVWLALFGETTAASTGYQYQWSPPNVAPDMWTNSGRGLLVWHTPNTMVINTDATTVAAGGFDAGLTVPRQSGKASIAGMTDLVLQGNKTLGTAGDIYLNPYSAGGVFLATGGGNVGIGNSATFPSMFNVGTSAQFQVSSTGNIVKLNNVTTSFPSSNSAGFLTNDGFGNLSWGSSTIFSTPITINGGTLGGAVPALTVTGTQTSSLELIGSVIDITSAGTGGNVIASRAVLRAGFTGTQTTTSLEAYNLVSGTGTNMNLSSANTSPLGNAGSAHYVKGVTTGTNVGGYSDVSGGNINYGSIFKSVGTKNSAANIGAVGIALNAGTSPIIVGGYFGMQSTEATIKANSVALVADNGAIAAPIFEARDNGTPVFVIADGGGVSGGTAANDDINIQGTSNATRTTSYVNLQPNGGNVGIGTSTPLNLLSLKGLFASIDIDANAASNAYISGSVASTIYSYFGTVGVTNGFITGSTIGDLAIRSENKNILFSTNTGTTVQMYLKNGGNVSVGSTTATSMFNVGTSAQFQVSSTGVLKINNTVNSVSPTAPNRTITIDIGGTTYYIHAKTSND